MCDENQFEALCEKANMVSLEVNRAVRGKSEVIKKVLLAMLGGGHILLEDVPGVGKTTMAMSFTKALSLDYKRLQFTPDVLPTDVTGFTVYERSGDGGKYHPGSIFCNLFLADEINRTSPKTQSALLEVMEENKVTVDGITRPVPKPFTVIATQNPVGSIGTQLLPESQLDRFMVKLTIGYPDVQSEADMLRSRGIGGVVEQVKSVATAEDLLLMQETVRQVHIEDNVFYYIAHLAAATRNHPALKLGLSPRGTVALTAILRAAGFLHGRRYVLPSDVKEVFSDVASHRIMLGGAARVQNLNGRAILEEILSKVSVPRLGR